MCSTIVAVGYQMIYLHSSSTNAISSQKPLSFTKLNRSKSPVTLSVICRLIFSVLVQNTNVISTDLTFHSHWKHLCHCFQSKVLIYNRLNLPLYIIKVWLLYWLDEHWCPNKALMPILKETGAAFYNVAINLQYTLNCLATVPKIVYIFEHMSKK